MIELNQEAVEAAAKEAAQATVDQGLASPEMVSMGATRKITERCIRKYLEVAGA